MKTIIVRDYKEMSKRAAEIVIEGIKANPNIVLGLATGSTPVGLYKYLIEAYEDGLDFSNVTTFNLDEYIGLEEGHNQRYDYFMNEQLFKHINIKKENVNFPKVDENGNIVDGDYERRIEEKGGIDIQILGIGNNGHIAFNEPAKELNVNTSIVKLTDSTIEANSRFFEKKEDVPKTAVTSGIGTIMGAKKILVLANGENKRPAVQYLLKENKFTTQWPVSVVKLHRDVTLIVDEICGR